MFASAYPEVIEGRQWLSATDVFDSEESDEDGYIDADGDASDEEDRSDSGEVGMSTGATEVVTKDVEEVHHSVKSSSFSSYMLKPPYLLTKIFIKDKKSHRGSSSSICKCWGTCGV